MSAPTLFDAFDANKSDNLLPKDGEAILTKNFFSKMDSDRLFKHLAENVQWRQEQIAIYDRTIDIPRLTAWYGDPDRAYTYSGIAMHPHAWTEELMEIKQRVEEKACTEFTSVLLNFYRSGKDSVAWHSDDEKELGINPTIASVSFGATRAFKFRHIKDHSLTQKVDLTHGSLLIMRGETQHNWQHEIPKTTKGGGRINLTFRAIH